MSSSIEWVQMFQKIVIVTEVGTFLCTEDLRFECAIISGEGDGRQQVTVTTGSVC